MGGYIIRTRDSEMLFYYCPTSTLTRTRTVSDDNDGSSDIENDAVPTDYRDKTNAVVTPLEPRARLKPRAAGMKTIGLALLQVRARSVYVADADSINGPLVACSCENVSSKKRPNRTYK